MQFSLTDKHRNFRDEISEFARQKIFPNAKRFDKTGEFPIENLAEMAGKGYLGIPIPKEYGGLGLDSISYLIGIEELSAACGSTGVITAVHTSVGTYPIVLFGNEEQKKKYVKPLATGAKIGAFALTEPSAGSDAAAIQTTATATEKNGESGYILNGGKIFISNGRAAGVVIVLGLTDKAKGHHGISAFIVEKGTPGYNYGIEEGKLGLHASEASELTFDNCFIPKENLLGNEGDGFKISMISLDGGRLGIAAQALGVARAALFETIKFSKENNFGGIQLSKQQGIQFKFADMATELDAARLLMFKAAYLKDRKLRYTKESAMAKMYASEVAVRVTNECSRIMGEFGYTRRSPLERYLREAKVTEIYEGTSEIQRIIIAKKLLK
jgi:alkylation response protein AidB-like acyl-CoA dehydrogenase